MKPKIYTASRASIPERSAMWRMFRDVYGCDIVSTWIDEAGEGETDDFSELWNRISAEIASCDKLVLYAEPEDFPLKGALIEVGIALGMGKPVVCCFPKVVLDGLTSRPVGSWIEHPAVSREDDIIRAMGGVLTGRTMDIATVTAVLKKSWESQRGMGCPCRWALGAVEDTVMEFARALPKHERASFLKECDLNFLSPKLK